MERSDIYACFFFAVTCVVAWYPLRKSKISKHLPPSPKSDPLIGHMRTLMGVTDEPKAYREWSKELGSDIISITLPPGQILVIVNSVEAAHELLTKRSSIYSDRAQTPMITSEKLLGWGNNTGMIAYGERWRAQRRMTHEVLHKKASMKMWPVVTRQVRLSLQRLVDEPSNFSKEVRRMVGSTLLSVVYGYEVTTSHDKLVEVVETAVAGFSQAAMISNFYVNVIPWLQHVPEWFPGAEWKRKANKWRSQTEDMLNMPFEWTRSQMAAGNAPPSMLTSLLAKCTGEETAEEIDALRWATGTLFAVSTSTGGQSAATVLVFIIAMAMHPDIQAKAQAEIDSVLRGTRLPEISDRESMPYMECILKEVFRWKHTVPLGVPHVSTQDDTYKGYFIPSGTLV
ncbi:O-methylsterigmatocystin oxidoreductase [Rhizoctonia solani]|uniref:O-methylsterigmatocystin oxidoreductase n=1 Tax=Rhizoctonia solani TaxID=456999 RepID=A0A0K6FPT4_9AGAM|nr:O-methylsterigmatocystin oxidoreductase [Rhizoctonia solani]